VHRKALSGDDLFVMTCYNAIVNGFRTATNSGPLCEEPIQNVAFIIEDAQLDPWNTKFGADPFGPISGQVIAALKEAYREAFLASSPRLVQPMYKVFIQAACGVLGRISAVIGRRKGRITNEVMVEGTEYFDITALLPVVGSFGLGTELRNECGGNVQPQMTFSHYEVLEQDPFWTPTTADEMDEFGHTLQEAVAKNNHARALIRMVRLRKGLKVEERVVTGAAKQRTLSRKK